MFVLQIFYIITSILFYFIILYTGKASAKTSYNLFILFHHEMHLT